MKQDLTDREMDVARMVAEGKKNGDIADALGIATTTVLQHIQNIQRKTGADGRVLLAQWYRDRVAA